MATKVDNSLPDATEESVQVSDTQVHDFRVIAPNGVNVRSFDSYNAPVVGTIDSGELIKNAVSVSDEWIQIGKNEYVMNQPYILEQL